MAVTSWKCWFCGDERNLIFENKRPLRGRQPKPEDNKMMEAMESEWTLKAAVWLFSGVVLAVMLLAIPKKAYIAVSRRWTWFTPNFLTAGRLPFVYLGYELFFASDLQFVGYMLVVFGTVVDRLDGKHATALEEATIAGVKGLPSGRTALGEWLDPLVDKLAFIPLFCVFAVKGIIVWWMVSIMVVFEFLGTAVRPPFNFWGRYMRSASATGIGKIKAGFMCISALVYMPFSLQWVESDSWIPHLPFAAATLFAALSVLSRVSINRKVDAMTHDVTSVFLHDD